MSRSLFCGVLALTFAVSACTTFQSSERLPASAASTYVNPQFEELRGLISNSLDIRARAIKFAELKKVDQGVDVKMTGAENNRLRTTGLEYARIRDRMLAIAQKDGAHFGMNKKVVLTPGKGTKFDTIRKPYIGAARGRPDTIIEVWNIDPLDSAGQKAIFDIQMGLASALILMDNYAVAIAPYVANKKVNYVLNYDIESQQKKLREISDSYTDPERRNQLSQAIDFVDKAMKFRREKMIDTNEQETFLYEIAQSSIWYVMVKNGETGTGIGDRLGNVWDRIMLRGTRGIRGLSYGASMGFGNMMGVFASRRGYLDNMPQSEREGLIKEMKPLDILLEKTPFRISDHVIPGHYGHVAIWIGTEEQLKDLKVWDDIPKDVQARIRSGHHIVEALRPGVQINTLDHFLNIDDFAVLRDVRSNITDEYRRQAILTAIRQIGKEYDFNFDVNTSIRIVCSEIAYVVFDDIEWPLEETVKRYSISPDAVAKMAVGNQRMFQPEIIYYKGKRLNKDLNYTLEQLLKDDDAEYAKLEQYLNQ